MKEKSILQNIFKSYQQGSMASNSWPSQALTVGGISYLLLAILALISATKHLALPSFLAFITLTVVAWLCRKRSEWKYKHMGFAGLLALLCLMSFFDRFISPLFFLGFAYYKVCQIHSPEKSWQRWAYPGLLTIVLITLATLFFSNPARDEDFILSNGLIFITGLSFLFLPDDKAIPKPSQQVFGGIDCNLRFKNLIRVACHDLSNPLTLILGSAQLAQSGAFAANPEKSLLFWQKVEGAAENINQLIANLRAYEAMQEPKRLIIRKIYIRSLIEDVCQTFQETFEQKKLQLKLDLSIDEQLQLMIDPHFFTINCLKKVLRNAIRFSPEGASIFVEAMLEGEDLIIKIRDQGPGIEDEVYTKLFQFDFMKEHIQQPGEKGHGFGLAIAKLIMQELGGDLSVLTQTRKKRPSSSDFTAPEPIAMHTGTAITLKLPLNFLPEDKSQGIDGRPITEFRSSESYESAPS